MRKIYSLMLIAAGLLIGTSLQAAEYSVSTKSGLDDAIKAVVANGADDANVITLTADINLDMNTKYCIFYGIENYDHTLTLNLNGHKISQQCDAKPATAAKTPIFTLYNGVMEINGPGTIESATNKVISLYGYDDHFTFASAPEKYTVLNVNNDVTLQIIADNDHHNTMDNNDGVNDYKHIEQVLYVDKANSFPADSIGRAPTHGDGKEYPKDPNAQAYGVVINLTDCSILADPLNNGHRCIQTSGNLSGMDTTKNVPVINATNVMFTAGSGINERVSTNGIREEGATALYGAGYAKWDLKNCAIEGCIAIYAKTGSWNISGCTIHSNGTTFSEPVAYNSGTNGGLGCAIVLDSHSSYGQFKGFTIENSVVTADKGYAIDEVATKGGSKLPDINVTSGVFKGEKGSIQTTDKEREKLKEMPDGEGITGGEWHNSDVNQYINEDINQTLVYFDADHKEYKIVVPIAGWKENDLSGNMVKLHNGDTYYILENQTNTISDKLFLTNSSKIVVKSGGVLNVGTLIISDGTTTDLSSVTVEPGGKLFVTGHQGVFSRDAECIKIEADATGNGLFLIAPEIFVNTHPLATVEYYANLGYDESEEIYMWDRFGLPVNNVLTMKKSNTTSPDVQQWIYSGAGYWQSVSSLGQFKPFTGYRISHAGTVEEVTYTFTGDLVGNASSKINFFATGYNFFANSYVAPASAKDMLNSVKLNTNVQHTIWIWDAANQVVKTTAWIEAVEGTGEFATVQPMQTFILQQMSGNSAVVDIDYTNAVWNFNKGVPTPVAARKMNGNADTYAKVIITAANGQSDRMSLREGNDYSDAFDNGAEATKIMSGRNINLYTTTDFAEMASVATDNILGTALNLQTRNDINYTMSFSNVRGEQYAIQDMETGVITNMEEGATYDFVAPANETIEGRFVVVAPRATPTNLQNAHVGANVMKTMQNGRLMIIKNGRCFNAMGVNVK